MKKIARIVIFASAFFLLAGNEACPVPEEGNNPPGSQHTPLNIGGANGALWQTTSDRTIRVTLTTADGQTATTDIEAGVGGVNILGRRIEVADFCFRSDAVCPHQVLPDNNTLIQPQPAVVTTQFNRRGILSELNNVPVLAGQVSGGDVNIPLEMTSALPLPCLLRNASAILGSASSSDPVLQEQKIADRIQGRINLRFTGECFMVGGSGALDPTDVIELSSSFLAQRQ